MPKTIDYPRTTYQSAWEASEVVDDTGGKCSLETCARKLNRKVSGSFKAILGSAVKFGLLTSKRELLTTTNLFRRIKHAYDKQEEILYHREAFLHPPLFTQICRKFRNRELPVHMFDIMLIREFGVEEINAQNVAKAFVDGARMTNVLDERNVIADIDLLAAQQGPRRELATKEIPLNLFRGNDDGPSAPDESLRQTQPTSLISDPTIQNSAPSQGIGRVQPQRVDIVSTDSDPISALFGLHTPTSGVNNQLQPHPPIEVYNKVDSTTKSPAYEPVKDTPPVISPAIPTSISLPTSAEGSAGYMIHISGPGLDTQIHIQDVDDLEIVRIMIEKIRKQLS